MINVGNTSTKEINRANKVVWDETVKDGKIKLDLINRDTRRVLRLIDELITLRSAQLMALREMR